MLKHYVVSSILIWIYANVFNHYHRITKPLTLTKLSPLSAAFLSVTSSLEWHHIEVKITDVKNMCIYCVRLRLKTFAYIQC